MNKKIFAVVLGLSLVLSAFLALAVRAQDVTDAINGLDKSASQIDAFKDQTKESFGSDFLSSKAGQAIGLILSFIGVIFLALMIYAGVMWMTSSGNDQVVTKAKDLIVNAVIGLVVVLAAYAITAFVSSELF